MPHRLIIPYRHNGGWAFDDQRTGLVAEQLIGGADTLMDRLVKYWESDGTVTKMGLRFSDEPSGHFRLAKVGVRTSGTEYKLTNAPCIFDDAIGHIVWLSPTLERFLGNAPDEIFFMLAPWPDQNDT